MKKEGREVYDLFCFMARRDLIYLSLLRIADKASSASGDGPKWRKGRLQFTDEQRGIGGPTHSHIQGCTKRFLMSWQNVC